jgi:hypothetical protein
MHGRKKQIKEQERIKSKRGAWVSCSASSSTEVLAIGGRSSTVKFVFA